MKKLAIIASTIALGACGQIQTGETGIWKYYGSVQPERADPGLHWYNPWSYDLITVQTATQPYDGQAISFTSDTQQTTISYRVSFHLQPDHAIMIYSQFGDQWANSLIPPAMLSTIKTRISAVTATNVVAHRAIIQNDIFQTLRARFAPLGISIDTFDMTNIDFTDAYEGAVEQAQVATQHAVAARNQTHVVEEEANQTRIRAEAEANRIRIEANAITSNPAIIEMRRVEKWNGQYCPQGAATCIIGGNTPGMMMNVGGH